MSDPSERSFGVVWPLMISQTIGAFNDNAMKAVLPLMAAVQIGKESMDTVNQQVSILLILPFVLLAPFAGWVSDRFSKKKVVSYALLGQLLGLGVLMAALFVRSLELALSGFFLLSVQSAVFSPAKKGILKELVGANRLGKAVGFMEMLAMVGILGGAFVGAFAFDQLVGQRGGWGAALILCAFVTGFAMVSWIVSWPTPETKAIRAEPFHAKILFSHFKDLAYLIRQPKLRYAALGDAWFWGLGSFFYLVLVKLSGEVVDGEMGMGSLYGYWFALLGVGIMAGSLFAAYLNKGRIEIGLTALGALGMPLCFLVLFGENPLSWGFDLSSFCLGFFGALFFVPLNGYLQDQAKENERGKILAATNLLTQASGIALILVHAFLSSFLGLTAKDELLVVFFPSLLIGIISFRVLIEDFCRSCLRMLLLLFYRIEVVGMGNFPKHGGCLLVCNHLSFADPVFIGAAFPRKIRYLAHSRLTESRLLSLVFDLTKTLTVSSEKSLKSLRSAVRLMKEGVPLCVFAEGGISRTGVTMPFMRGPVVLAKGAQVSVVPVHLDKVWGSVFSMERGIFFKKFPRRWPYRVKVRVGQVMEGDSISQENCRNAVMELGRQSFFERAEVEREALASLRKKLLRQDDGIFLLGEEGQPITRRRFLNAVFQDDHDLSPLIVKWASEVREVLDGNERLAEIHLCNWMRVKETHFWDYQKLRLSFEEELWLRQWLPWAGILWGWEIRIDKEGFHLNASTPKRFDSELGLSGFATASNGLVSINASSSEERILNQELDQQKIFKDGALGRVLAGYSHKMERKKFILRGKIKEEFDNLKVDEDGFLSFSSTG